MLNSNAIYNLYVQKKKHPRFGNGALLAGLGWACTEQALSVVCFL
jgi:hypothetical protein